MNRDLRLYLAVIGLPALVFAVGESLRREVEHFELAHGEEGRLGGGYQSVFDFGREDALSGGDRADRGDDLRLRRRLHETARSARVERAAHVLRRAEGREDQHADRGVLLQDRDRGVRAAQLRHHQVHHHDVRFVHARERDGLLSGVGLRDHLEVGLERDDGRDAHPDDEMVVREENPRLAAVCAHAVCSLFI